MVLILGDILRPSPSTSVLCGLQYNSRNEGKVRPAELSEGRFPESWKGRPDTRSHMGTARAAGKRNRMSTARMGEVTGGDPPHCPKSCGARSENS